MGNRGQSIVEYIFLLAIFALVAVAGWQTFPSVLEGFYTSLSQRRAGINGMLP